MENRVREIIWYIVLGLIFLIAGLVWKEQSYSIVFFLMTAVFFLAIFRPSRFP